MGLRAISHSFLDIGVNTRAAVFLDRRPELEAGWRLLLGAARLLGLGVTALLSP